MCRFSFNKLSNLSSRLKNTIYSLEHSRHPTNLFSRVMEVTGKALVTVFSLEKGSMGLPLKMMR